MNSQLLRFVLVGGLTAAVYYGVLFVLVEFFAVGVLTASSSAYIGAIVLNYWLHHAWTFASQVPHQVATVRYIMMCAVGFLINYTVMFLGVKDDDSHYLLVQTLAVACVVVWNFIVSSLWVYRHS